jgi:hypothetical protein
VISLPLLKQMKEADEATPLRVVIDLNLEFKPNRSAAEELALHLIDDARTTAGQVGMDQGSGLRARDGWVGSKLRYCVTY